MSKTTLAISLFALTAIGRQQLGTGAPGSVAPFPLQEERMFIEHNVSLGEAVVRVEAESEEELDRIQVDKPDGEQLFALAAPTGKTRGLSGFEIELDEDSLASVLATYAAGDYDIHARTADGRAAEGSARLSLDLPPAPQLIYPQDGAVDVPTSGLVVRWHPDRWASGYHVQMEQGESDGLAIQVPPGRNSLRIPDGLLARGTATQLEIAAIGPGGNRTVIGVHFTTQ